MKSKLPPYRIFKIINASIKHFKIKRVIWIINKSGSRTTTTTPKMESFVIIVNGFQLWSVFDVVAKWSVFDVVAVLDPPLIKLFRR